MVTYEIIKDSLQTVGGSDFFQVKSTFSLFDKVLWEKVENCTFTYNYNTSTLLDVDTGETLSSLHRKHKCAKAQLKLLKKEILS